MHKCWWLVAISACGGSAGPAATGDVGAWTAGPALPVARANHCSAAIGDWVVVIGGNHADGSAFASTDEIDAAQLAGDGTLGTWQVAGHTASPVNECTATSDGTTLYLIDGLYDDDSDDGHIYAADLDGSGMLGALTSIGDLPDGVVIAASEATVRDHELLVMNTELPDAGNTTVTLRTELGGSALAWTTDDWRIGFREQAQYAFAGDDIYTLGGYGGDAANTVLADAFVAPVDTGDAQMTTALPQPTAFGEAVGVDDWIFVAGGRDSVFGGGATTAVYAGQATADGTIAAWQAATPLPMPRTNHDMVRVGDYLVLTGGADTGPGDTTVLLAQVRE
jgi:hypothetical protein